MTRGLLRLTMSVASAQSGQPARPPQRPWVSTDTHLQSRPRQPPGVFPELAVGALSSRHPMFLCPFQTVLCQNCLSKAATCNAHVEPSYQALRGFARNKQLGTQGFGQMRSF